MPKNAIFGRFSCNKFFPGKNFKNFFLILIKGSITVSLIPISKSVYPGQQNIAFFGGMQMTELERFVLGLAAYGWMGLSISTTEDLFAEVSFRSC